jgi:hypothetical protein
LSILLLPELLESYSESHCLCIYLQVFSHCFPLVASKFHVLHLNWFLCRVIDRALVLVFYIWISSLPQMICWRGYLFSNVCYWCFAKNQMAIPVWAYFCVFYSMPLIYMSVFVPVPCRSCYYALQYNLKSGIVTPPALPFFAQDCVSYSESILLLMHFRMDFLFLWRTSLECWWGFHWIIDHFQKYSHFHNINPANPST